jgi:hypothetical protein
MRILLLDLGSYSQEHWHPSTQVKLPGDVGDIGFKQAMQQKWLALDKSSGTPTIVRKVSRSNQLHQHLFI